MTHKSNPVHNDLLKKALAVYFISNFKHNKIYVHYCDALECVQIRAIYHNTKTTHDRFYAL